MRTWLTIGLLGIAALAAAADDPQPNCRLKWSQCRDRMEDLAAYQSLAPTVSTWPLEEKKNLTRLFDLLKGVEQSTSSSFQAPKPGGKAANLPAGWGVNPDVRSSLSQECGSSFGCAQNEDGTWSPIVTSGESAEPPADYCGELNACKSQLIQIVQLAPTLAPSIESLSLDKKRFVSPLINAIDEAGKEVGAPAN